MKSLLVFVYNFQKILTYKAFFDQLSNKKYEVQIAFIAMHGTLGMVAMLYTA